MSYFIKFLVICFACLLFCANQINAQSIALGAPTSMTHLNNANVVISITDGSNVPQRVYLTWVCTASIYSGMVGVTYVTDFSSVEHSQSGSVAILDITGNGLMSVATKNGVDVTFFLDGTYTVTALYVRPVSLGGGTISSASRTGVRLDSITLPFAVVYPTHGVTVPSLFTVDMALNELAATNSVHISVWNSTHFFNATFNGLSAGGFIYNWTVSDGVFDLGYSKLVSISAGEIFNLTSGSFYNFSFYYRDTNNHPYAQIDSYNVYADFVFPVVTMVTPISNDIIQWGYFNKMNLSFTMNKENAQIYVIWTDVQTSEVELSIVLNSGIASVPSFPMLNPTGFAYTYRNTLTEGVSHEYVSFGTYNITSYIVDSRGRQSASSIATNVVFVMGNFTCIPVYVNNTFLVLQNVPVIEYTNVTVNNTIEVLVASTTSVHDLGFAIWEFSLIITGVFIGGGIVAISSMKLWEYYQLTYTKIYQ